MTTGPTIPADLSSITLRSGCGTGAEGDRCAIQEYRAWRGLDPASDGCPEDVCVVLHGLVTGLNDRSGAWRKALLPWLPKLTGSRGDMSVTQRRAFKAADFAVRVFAPIALDAAGFTDDASKLRALAEIVDIGTARLARDAADAAANAAARAAAYAVRAADAAAYAAYAAYAAAARAAAYAAPLSTDPIAILDAILGIK